MVYVAAESLPISEDQPARYISTAHMTMVPGPLDCGNIATFQILLVTMWLGGLSRGEMSPISIQPV